MNLDIDVMLVAAFVVAALVTVVAARLLRAVIGLALTSALVALLLFRLHAPIAAVFELSVCAGLIPAIFLVAIGMTQRLTAEDVAVRRHEKTQLFWALPLVLICAGILLTQVPPLLTFAPPSTVQTADVRHVLWNQRHMDLLGQVAILLGAAFSVVALVKEAAHEQ